MKIYASGFFMGILQSAEAFWTNWPLKMCITHSLILIQDLLCTKHIQGPVTYSISVWSCPSSRWISYHYPIFIWTVVIISYTNTKWDKIGLIWNSISMRKVRLDDLSQRMNVISVWLIKSRSEKLHVHQVIAVIVPYFFIVRCGGVYLF